jgi:hypothetical protein
MTRLRRFWHSYGMWRLRTLPNRLGLWLVWRLPHRLVYWSFIRVAVEDYGGNPDDRSISQALQYYGRKHLGDA